ncbi:unnamed protein product [Mytilus coruscus]|uniref:Integrase zinc-binding domain-containing protein n=1 Tax=Mytilus coruscus TaxID=42192 RepID=A0A6J8E726_MYTCO|nr:unnamed protein product [Mytilus coruscus]
MEDRLSAMLTNKLNSSVAEMSAIQANNNNQSNGPFQRYQQRPKTNFQQQNYQRPPVSSCHGCGNLNLKKTHVYSVLCIGQQKLRVLGKVLLTIQIKGKCYDFDFHVIDTLPHSLIIGVDFLETNNVTINLSRKSMEISDKCAKICSLEINSGLARCIKSCALPANSEIVLPVHVSRRIHGEQVLLEPNPNLEKKQLMGARCIVTVNQGKSVFRIINSTNKTVHLPRRYVLANAINVDEQFMETLDNAKVKSINTIETKPKNTNRDNLEFDLSKAELTSQQNTVIAAVQDDNATVQIEQKEDIGTLQRKCTDFEDIYAYLNDGTLPENNKLARKVNIESQQYSLLNGILYHWYQRRTKKPDEQARQHQQLALPRVLRDAALLAYYDSQSGGAHLATKKVYEALKLKYYWPKMHQQDVIEKLKIAKEIATDNVNRRQEKNKEHYDKKDKEPDFMVGQKGLIRVYKVPPGLSRKLQDKSDGPYLMTQLGPNHTYRLMNCKTRKVMKSLINAQHLRIYHDPRLFRRQDDIIVTSQNNDEETMIINQMQITHKRLTMKLTKKS